MGRRKGVRPAGELHRPGCGCGFRLLSLLGPWVGEGWGFAQECGETEVTLMRKGAELGLGKGGAGG